MPEFRERIDQCLRIRVFRIIDHLIGISEFHQVSLINDRYPVAQIAGSRQTMGDEHECHLKLIPHFYQNIEDLC